MFRFHSINITFVIMSRYLSNPNHVFRPARVEVNEQAVINLYSSGASVLSMSKQFNVSRNAIERVIAKNKLPIRNGSEANLIRFKNASLDEKRKVVKKANEAMRKLPHAFHHESSIKQAISKEISLKKVGQFETDIIEYLKKFNYNPIPQKAFGTYNIDIAIGNIAIEVHVNSANPHAHPYFMKRIIMLLKGNWNVIYLKITQGGLNKRGFDQLRICVDFFSHNPSIAREYRMMRGTGEAVAIGHLNGDNLTIVRCPE